MRIITWNVNSVRARLERLLALLSRHQPDVVLLQETKSLETAFPRAQVEDAGYHVEVHGQKTYNGVALLSRQPLTAVERGFEGDPIPAEARVISAEAGGVRLINVYVVNGQALGADKYLLKLEWLDALVDWIARGHSPSGPLLVAGDFNIAPEDRDVYSPEIWRDRVLVSDPERQRYRRLVEWGLADLLRVKTDDDSVFTWWDYRGGAFPRNHGLRIDLMLGTAPVAARLLSMEVDREERKKSTGPGAPSDHAPVILDLEPALAG